MGEFLVETYRVLDCLDTTEYVSLSAVQKTVLGLIVSAGKINFSDNSKAKILLWDIFDENTITGAAFRDCVNGLISPPPVEEP